MATGRSTQQGVRNPERDEQVAAPLKGRGQPGEDSDEGEVPREGGSAEQKTRRVHETQEREAGTDEAEKAPRRKGKGQKRREDAEKAGKHEHGLRERGRRTGGGGGGGEPARKWGGREGRAGRGGTRGLNRGAARGANIEEADTGQK